MRYTDEQIRENIVRFIEDTEQPELAYVVDYCIGYYGKIDRQIWRIIIRLGKDNIIIG